MYRNLFILLLAVYFAPLFLGAKAIGPNVSVYRNEELKWEDGAYGYHVMFKTLLENLKADSGNPQADTCMDEATGSTYTLDASHTPSDAFVARAFLVWSGAVPIAEANDPTDNEVTLSFVSEDGKITENQVIKGKKAYKVSEAQGFEFDAFKDIDEPQFSYFTYRVDITDFFKSIHDKGRALGLEYDGYSLYGNYTMKDLKCAEDPAYIDKTVMVSGWSIVMIYTSKDISPKKIYLYDGFKSYWYEESEINVTGFEFPTDPEVRITLNTHEGDPNLASIYEDDNVTLAGPEGLQVQGDQVGWLLLSNECNPEAFKTDGLTTLYYTEIYNSISSVYGWNDVVPTCIGGVPPVWDNEKIEYSMDADTFVMDSASDGSYASHFNKGGTRIGLRIGANQDQVITNYMVVSVDTKAPRFDIPGQPEKVACTPANIAVDPLNADSKWCENKLDHVFAIRVQNWGDDITPAVIVKDTIPVGMEYVAGSTEYANKFTTEKGKKKAVSWIKIPDNGGFPLEGGFKVADKINFCGADSDYLACEDLIMVRFRARVKDETQKNAVIENVASIDTTGFPTYKTNLGLPVKLKLATTGCVSNLDDINLDDCGGKGAVKCETDENCLESYGAGYICDLKNNICIPDPDIKRCKDSDVTISVGKNSPLSDVIFIAPQENLVLGQVAIAAASGSDCYFNLSKVKLKVEADDPNISISNIKLVNDTNGNGIADTGEAQLGVSDIKNEYADFSSTDPANRLWGNKVNNLIFIADAGYMEGEAISRNASFTPAIEEFGITLADDGTVKSSGLPLSFSKFQFEPDDAFIVTKGPNDPAVPAKNEMNGTHDILQLRVISKGSADSIKSLKIKIPKSTMASFGQSISSLSIYEDTNNDGKGDTKIATATSTDNTQSHLFKLDIPVVADTVKYLTIRADLSLSDGEYFQLQVFSVSTESETTVLGTPVNSKEYSYTCDPMYEECDSTDSCTCSVTAPENEGYAGIIMLISVLAAALFFFTRKERRNS
ncbi:MAG TPA: hypothetical protein PLZ43_09305 [bacterium]|nr:hypothetical protein [bacterium]